jgi:hypothetical protein
MLLTLTPAASVVMKTIQTTPPCKYYFVIFVFSYTPFGFLESHTRVTITQLMSGL